MTVPTMILYFTVGVLGTIGIGVVIFGGLYILSSLFSGQRAPEPRAHGQESDNN